MHLCIYNSMCMLPNVCINNAVVVILLKFGVSFYQKKKFEVLLYIQCCVSVTVVKIYLHSSRKLLLIFFNLMFDTVMLIFLLR